MLTDKREVYAPFEYQQAYDFWEKQQQAHWLHNEISLSSDINDWKVKLSHQEKNVIGNILKGFTQAEVLISNYWSSKVPLWFPKPEICMASLAMANMETIHTKAYAYLNESLGLMNFDAFLYEPTTKARLDKLIDAKGDNLEEMALSLAIFSGFAEGVQLFSSFAVLMSFSRFNLMKGVGQIVAFSVKDETLHSNFGCWLFRTLIQENPEIWTDDLKRTIYESARTMVSMEDNFIDKVFEFGDIQGINAKMLKNFIRMRANVKLNDLGLKNNWKNLDKGLLKEMEWFDYLTTGLEVVDFFAARPTGYSKSVNFDSIFD
jgi:ribonucleoside-diphosphate reductase beta chain